MSCEAALRDTTDRFTSHLEDPQAVATTSLTHCAG